MGRHLRHRAQRALRCFASALASDDPKAYVEAWGWTPQGLRKLVDAMYPPDEAAEEFDEYEIYYRDELIAEVKDYRKGFDSIIYDLSTDTRVVQTIKSVH